MKTYFLIFTNEAFKVKAHVCEESIKRFYSPRKYHINVAHHNAKLIPGSFYLDGFAGARIKAVRDALKNFDCVVMLGADCVLYDNIDSLLSNPGRIVLVPHVITPPRNVAPFYRTGHANGDVVLFRKNALEIVDWLLTQPMRLDIPNGMFFEQSLLSSLPFIFDGITICKDPAINYAYFNFFERKLNRIKGRFFIGRRRLALCQFSGYVDGQPEKISRYYNGPTPTKEILTLFREYERELQAKAGKQRFTSYLQFGRP